MSSSLKIISLFILLVGLGCAGLIYRTAENVPPGSVGFEQGDEAVYPVLPSDSKKYLRDLELFGGKANVLMDRIRRWFIGLWQGKPLAFTLSGITVLLSAGIFFLAHHVSVDSKPDHPQGKNQTPIE
ncbi:MAG: hypothetical protein C0407_12190 [Desulfobacca sp.]|nr:hypothetical protein [Desulfobacca sp.]